jgi:hypothetical protein
MALGGSPGPGIRWSLGAPPDAAREPVMKSSFGALLLVLLLPTFGVTQDRVKFPVGVSSKVLGYGHLWATEGFL